MSDDPTLIDEYRLAQRILTRLGISTEQNRDRIEWIAEEIRNARTSGRSFPAWSLEMATLMRYLADESYNKSNTTIERARLNDLVRAAFPGQGREG